MTDANEITNIVFSALSDRKGFDDWFDQIDEELQAEIKAEIAEALAALRAQPESVCPECHCHFTANEVTSPGTTRLVNTAQPDHIVDVNGMVDHSELVKRLRYYATRGMDAYVVAADCDRAADALEAIGETK